MDTLPPSKGVPQPSTTFTCSSVAWYAITFAPRVGDIKFSVNGRFVGLQPFAAGSSSALAGGAAPVVGDAVATATILMFWRLPSPNSRRKLQLWTPAISLVKSTWTLMEPLWLTVPVAGTGPH